MSNEREPVAKRIDTGLVEYVCPKCGWYDLSSVFQDFLPFIDHLIQDLCWKYHPMLSQPVIQHDGTVWFRKPGTNNLILGLPQYSPDSEEWKVLLEGGAKILPQAKIFLTDIADWLHLSLASRGELKALKTSDVFTAERLVSLVETLGPEFRDQRNYLLRFRKNLEETGMDPKWTGNPGKQAGFVARSMAAARWGFTVSSSREMIRQGNVSERKDPFTFLKLPNLRGWWLPS